MSQVTFGRFKPLPLAGRRERLVSKDERLDLVWPGAGVGENIPQAIVDRMGFPKATR